ncbi:MAG: MATE family efflux transporter [Clostridia bacterium]|nr:MATE family efflux transporter [Clostridia bacterium]
MAKKNEIDMTSGPLLKKILIFTIPLILTSILQLLFNAADIIVVGRFAGDDSLAAVGSTGSIVNLIVNLFIGLSIGANVIVSRYCGANKQEYVSKSVHTSMTLSVIGGFVIMAIGLFISKPMLVWMDTPESILPLADTYVKIYFLGMPANMIFNFGSAVLRAKGDTKRPLYFLIISGIVNVILNLIFVILFHMDVAGVGLATIISQYLSMAMLLYCLFKEEGGFKLEIKKLRMEKDMVIEIIKIGLPCGIQSMLFSFSNVLIQSSINSFGNIAVAGNSAAVNIEGFVYVSMNAFSQAAISFTGQNLGAGKYSNINRIMKYTVCCAFVVGLVLGQSCYYAGRPLLSIYTENPAVIEAGLTRLGIVSFLYFTCGIMDAIVGVLRGLGYSLTPMIVTLLGVCALRVVFLSTAFYLPIFHYLEVVYYLYPISWTITIAAHLITYKIVYNRDIKAFVLKEKNNAVQE